MEAEDGGEGSFGVGFPTGFPFVLWFCVLCVCVCCCDCVCVMLGLCVCVCFGAGRETK